MSNTIFLDSENSGVLSQLYITLKAIPPLTDCGERAFDTRVFVGHFFTGIYSIGAEGIVTSNFVCALFCS